MARTPRIAVDVEANVAGLVSDLRVASQAVTQFTGHTKRQMDQATVAMRNLQHQADSVGRFLKNSFAGIQTVGLLSTLAGLADRYTNLDAKLKLVARSTAEYNKSYEQTRIIAKDTYASIEATVSLYQRVSNATRELGTSQDEVLRIVRTVNQAFLVSGATSTEASASIIQLTQAFGAGVLRGEEFNSVAEQSPRLLQAIARTMGVPRASLKELAAEGKITIDVLRNTLTGPEADAIAKEASRMPLTIERAFGLLRNEALMFVGEADKVNGTAAGFARGLRTLAENFTMVADAAVLLGKVIIVTWFARLAGAAGESVKRMYDSARATAENARMAKLASLEAADNAGRQAIASLQVQKAEAAELAAKRQNIAATQAAIVAAREEYVAKLNRANITIRESQATIAAAKAAGQQSFAVRELARAEIALAQAQAVRSASMGQLALLGQQQSRLNAGGPIASVAASPGRFSPQQIQSVQGSVQALLGAQNKISMFTGLVGKAGAALSAFVGGPVGIALVSLYGLYTVYSKISDAIEANLERQRQFSEGLKEVSETAQSVIASTGRQNFSPEGATESYYKSAATVNEANKAIESTTKRLADLRAMLGQGTRDTADFALLEQIRALDKQLTGQSATLNKSKTDFDAMTGALRQRLGPAFDEVIAKAATMNGASFEDFKNSLTETTQAAIVQLDALGKKLNSTVASLPRTITEMQRKVRDTGANAATTSSNLLKDLIEDGRQLNMPAEYFQQIQAAAPAYVRAAVMQEAADKRLADTKKEATAATKAQTAATRDAAKVGDYIDSLKAKTEQLKLEALYGRNATEAEREIIKFDYMLRDSKNAVYGAREQEIRAILEGNRALEVEALSRNQAIDAAQRELQVRRQVADFVDGRAQSQQRELGVIKYGQSQNDMNNRFESVAQEFRDQRKSIDEAFNERLSNIPDVAENAKLRNDLQREYISLLGITVTAEAQAMEREREYLRERLAAQSDWKNGARSAMQDYAYNAKDIAGQTREAFTGAFTQMEDAVVKFVTTGKLSFTDFATSALTDFIRMETRILLSKVFEWLTNWAIGAMTGTTGVSGSQVAGINSGIATAAHGRAFSNRQEVHSFARGHEFTNKVVSSPTYMPMAKFGEAGDEAIMPLARDRSGSLGVKASMGGNNTAINLTVNTTINSNGSEDSATEGDSNEMGRLFAKTIEHKVHEGISESMRPGGPIYNYVNEKARA